jgi:hypothetical protein
MKASYWMMTIACLMAVGLTASAGVTDPNIITGVVKVSSLAEEELLVVNGGMIEGTLTHVDRTFVFGDVNDLVGIDFVMTAVDDKSNADMHYQVTLDKAGTLMLLIDNRVGSGTANDPTTPPKLSSGVMGWAVADGFAETSYVVYAGTAPMTAFVRPVAAGTYDLYAQNDGGTRITYLVAAIPDGWNLRPSIVGVPATAQVSPGDKLSINADVTDFGENTATAVLWEQIDAGQPVTFLPGPDSEEVEVVFPGGEGSYQLRITATDGDGLVSSKTINVSVKVPTFAVQATQHLNACNDTQYAPTSRQSPTVLAVRNYSNDDASTTRRRVGYHKYDINTLKEDGKMFTNCYLTFNVKARSSSKNIYIYAINEEQDNFDLTASSASWSTAPGIQNEPLPPRSAEITIDMLDKRDIYPILMPFAPAGTGIQSTPVCVALDEVLNADTDGFIMLMFITYDPQNADFEFYSISDSRIDPESGLKGIVLKGEKRPAVWATKPAPQINTTASTGLAQLSWVNPLPNEPEGVITCDVYIGTGEPNALQPNYGFTTLGVGIAGNSIAVPYGLLQRNMTYNWIVDVHDTSRDEVARGFVWTFSTTNSAPEVSVGAPQYLWLNNDGDPNSATAHLSGTVSDDGFPEPYTLWWSLLSGPEKVEVVIDPNDVEDISVVLPALGTYLFGLSADDSDLTTTATIQVVVAATPCDAAKAKPGYTTTVGDLDNNCYVDISDFAAFAAHWLECHSFMDAPCN